MAQEARPAWHVVIDYASQDQVSSLDAEVVLVVAEVGSGMSCDTLVAGEVEGRRHAYLDMAMACVVEAVEEPSFQADTDAASPSAEVSAVRMVETADAESPWVVVLVA